MRTPTARTKLARNRWGGAFVVVALLGAVVSGCSGKRRGQPSYSPPSSTAPASSAQPAAASEAAVEFAQAQSCQSCHPIHFQEWEGSVMHYGAESPVFNAFELTVRKLTNGAVGPNGTNPNFCTGCHAPTTLTTNELPDYVSEATARPASEFLSPVARDGVSCDVCHSVSGPDRVHSFLEDGIANFFNDTATTETKRGPIGDPLETEAHGSEGDDYFSSSQFCGACHDVRVPKADLVTGEPFQRFENLFTEWREGPYATTQNPYGEVVSCQDCHMSLFPLTEPGVYGQALTADVPGAAVRKHTNHAFTAVSLPLVADDPRFPSTLSEERDAWGYPLGQQARRAQMLEAACTVTLEGTPAAIDSSASVLPVKVVVTNVGAGHKVPAGFSQERQVWVELIVRDEAGVIYESGVLHDKAHPETGELEPDGRLDDEDLEDLHFEIDPATFDTHATPGPDHNQREQGVNLGLANFQNRFIRIRSDGSWEQILNPLLADHCDNSQSLEMLVPRVVPYDIPLTRPLVGKVEVSARLRFRAFPPEFLRFLAMREPELVTEEHVDRNTIVDMASAFGRVAVVR
jgi:hypothetical protein